MKKMLKVVSLILACVLSMSALAGCGKKEEADSNEGFSVTFGEPGTNRDQEAAAETLERWQSYSEVPIEWDFLGSESKQELQLRFAGSDFPQVILGNYLQATDVSKYASMGILVPLDEYINEKDTPNLYKLFKDYPKTEAANKLPDGHMYSLPQFVELEEQYLETALFINKTWLDKLGLEIPKTLDDLYEVLKAFKTEDPNGNGQADEIPMSFAEGSGFSYPEALLSCFGISAKHGVFDGFTSVKNGKVSFAPMTDEWKEMIKFYNKLYSEGLLDMECFTHNYNQFLAKLASPESKVGFVWSSTNPMLNADEYVAIEPIYAEGYEACWHMNPGIIGSRNLFSITTNCKNPKAAMKWIDKFYSAEASLQNLYGAVGRTFTVDDSGKYIFNEPAEGESLSTMFTKNTVIAGPAAIYADMIGTVVEQNDMWKEKAEIYKLYKDQTDQENWPRPYYSVDESNRFSELSTDIFSYVNEKKAKWIIGKDDVESDWDEYMAHLEKLGIKEMMKINQDAFDRYSENIK